MTIEIMKMINFMKLVCAFCFKRCQEIYSWLIPSLFFFF